MLASHWCWINLKRHNQYIESSSNGWGSAQSDGHELHTGRHRQQLKDSGQASNSNQQFLAMALREPWHANGIGRCLPSNSRHYQCWAFSSQCWPQSFLNQHECFRHPRGGTVPRHGLSRPVWWQLGFLLHSTSAPLHWFWAVCKPAKFCSHQPQVSPLAFCLAKDLRKFQPIQWHVVWKGS